MMSQAIYRDSLDSEKQSNDALLRKDDSCFLAPRREPFYKSTRFLLGFHLILFSIYAGVTLCIINQRNDLRQTGQPFSPAIAALEYQEQHFTLEDKIQERGSYSGRPNADLDKAWHDLLNAENIIVEPEYMRHYDREDIAVAVPEGGGYIATLNVYHELHCLKRLHQYMYSDYYFGDLNDRQREMNRLHNEHCIDFLRQSAMCHGDVGLITFEWHGNSRIPVANATSHQCVNWQKLDKWTRERTVDMLKPGWLVHPTMGVAYPDGEGDKVGAVDSQSGHHPRS